MKEAIEQLTPISRANYEYLIMRCVIQAMISGQIGRPFEYNDAKAWVRASQKDGTAQWRVCPRDNTACFIIQEPPL